MTDPRDFDQRTDFGRRSDIDRRMDMEHRMGSPTPWGWIAGAVVIIVILTLVFTSGDGTKTASTDDGTPPATTGMAPKIAPPAISVPPRQEHPADDGSEQTVGLLLLAALRHLRSTPAHGAGVRALLRLRGEPASHGRLNVIN